MGKGQFAGISKNGQPSDRKESTRMTVQEITILFQ